MAPTGYGESRITLTKSSPFKDAPNCDQFKNQQLREQEKNPKHFGEEGDSSSQLEKLQVWLKEQQPKVKSAKDQFFEKLDSRFPSSVSLRTGSYEIVKNEADNVIVCSDEINDEAEEEGKGLVRKVGAAVVGGALIVTGIPLIPLPGPGDFMVVGGFAVLATEFEAPRRVLDGARDKLVDVLDERESLEKRATMNENDKSEDEAKSMHCMSSSKESDAGLDAALSLADATKELKKHADTFGRKVLLPMLNQVCTERPADIGEEQDSDEEFVMCDAVSDADTLSEIDYSETENCEEAVKSKDVNGFGEKMAGVN